MSVARRAPPIGRGRRTRETHADPPVIACGYEDKGKQTADERLGIGAESFLRPAAVGGRQKDTTPLRTMGQPPILGAPAHRLEPRLRSDLRIVRQLQRFDALLLRVGDHRLDPAAITAGMTIPVLYQRQVS